jgi:putative transposase
MSLTYGLLRLVLGHIVRRAQQRSELEVLVLRHQLDVMRRQVARPHFSRGDRLLLAAASQVLPQVAWRSFLVTSWLTPTRR